jgi:hypothetical protein
LPALDSTFEIFEEDRFTLPKEVEFLREKLDVRTGGLWDVS